MNTSTPLLAALAMAAGSTLAMQPGINGQLSKGLQRPFLAALISFGVGFLALLTINLVRRDGLPGREAFSSVPVWIYVGGGLLGAFAVTTALSVAPRLGAATWISLLIAGQMLTSLALDHFGLVGFATSPINGPRIVGAVLLITGVALIAKH